MNLEQGLVGVIVNKPSSGGFTEHSIMVEQTIGDYKRNLISHEN